MTDETLASDDATTPDEAPVPYEPLGEVVEGSTHVDTPTAIEVQETPADSEHYVEVDLNWVGNKQEQEQSFWDTVVARPPFILSFVESDHPQGGFVVGWDTCGACNLHLRSCTCKNGPEQPKYVKNWRPAADKNHDKPQPVTPAVRKAVVAADPQTVEKAVDEALNDDGTKVRKRRADAGVKRGPRKDPNATADSVAEAAGSLADAMTKE
jgi:hypothetical protein